MGKIDIGQHFSFYLDIETGVFSMETRSFGPDAYLIEIPVSRIIKYIRPKKEKGDSFEDMSKKKVKKVVIYEK